MIREMITAYNERATFMPLFLYQTIYRTICTPDLIDTFLILRCCLNAIETVFKVGDNVVNMLRSN